MHKFPSNRRLIVALFMLVIAACYSIGLNAQRISETNVNVIAGKSTLIDSITHPDLVLVKEVNLNSPDFTVGIVNGAGYGTVRINPTHTFTGVRQATVEYILDVNGTMTSNYRIYNINFTNSMVKVNDDVVMWDGQGTLNIDVKANDIYSYSGATLRINQSSGIAGINNGSITYSNPSFTGPDYVHYTLTDSLGTSDHGIIKIEPEIPAPTENVQYNFTLNYLATKAISIPANFVKILDPFQGELLQTSGVGHFVYKPYDEAGLDTFKFAYNGDTITYVAKILDVQKDPGLIKNDVVYVAENSTVSFDVFKNDLIQNLPIDTFSPQLIHDTLGVFSYNAGGKGAKNFFYKATTAIGQETGKINVKIDNFVPNQDIPYVFEVLKNQSLTIEYNMPIDGYTFTLDQNQAPQNAAVIIAYDSLAVSCGTSYGKAIIHFIPDNNFIGSQDFVVNYCVGSQCTPIKITVNTINEASGACPCIDNCVYKGDLNNDGRVDKDDLLILGRYLGYSGPQRTGLGLTANIGELSQEWEATSVYDTNLKHADSNGDGFLTADDATAIYDNYGKLNKFVKKEQLTSKEYDLKITIEPAEADSGDLVTVYYSLGTNSKPINDVFGISFGTSFDWGDSSSVVNEFYNNSWFTDNSPNLSFFKQISNGVFRHALTRTSGSGISGNGAIGQMSVIVDEADGFKDSENSEYYTGSIITDEIIIEDSEGNKFSLPEASATIKINKKKREIYPNSDQLIAYPNPTDNVIFLHFNGGNIIQEVEVSNSFGNVIGNYANINSQSYQIPMLNLASGIYFLKVRTDKALVNKKVVKR